MKNYLLVLVILLLLILPFGCGQPAEPELPTDENSVEDDPGISGPVMGMTDEPILVDGLADGYPAEAVEAMGGLIHLAHDGENLYLHFALDTAGWISVGFNSAGGGMDGANMIIAYLEGDNPAYREDLGRGRSHAAVSATAVNEFYLAYDEDGLAVLELKYPLAFPTDQGFNLEGLVPGQEYTLIFASHNSSHDIDSTHSNRGSFNFTVEP